VYLIKEARKSLGLDPEAPIEMKRAELVSEQEEQAEQEEPAVSDSVEDAPEILPEDAAAEDGDDSGSQE
jgi:hypothetical protein